MLSAKQIRLAMTHLGLTLTTASEAIPVGKATLQKLAARDENIDAAATGTTRKVKMWFESQGIEFDDDGENVRLKPSESPKG